MISESDFVMIPFLPDMTMAGIRYACLSLTNSSEFVDRPINRLRMTVARKAAQLGFKRYLDKAKIPYDILGSTPFSDPDQYDIAIGGRRCDIRCFMITKKKHIRSIRKEPHLLLNTQARVPVDQISGNDLIDDDILIFTFITALITPNHSVLKKALTAGQPIYLMNAFPGNWARSAQWVSLGKILVNSNEEAPLRLELGGRNIHHQYQTEYLVLNPQEQAEVRQNFFALSYLHTPNLPDETIGVFSPVLNETYFVEPMAWGNLWVYGIEIIFAGYITLGEFQKNARRSAQAIHWLHPSSTCSENLTIPIQDLQPLTNLFDHAKSWTPI